MFECSAVGTEAGSFSFYYLAEDAREAAHTWQEYFDLVGSLDRAHVVRALGDEAPGLERFIVETKVPVVTLSALLNKWNLNAIDALVVDAEGQDWNIVRQALEIGLRPDVILFEHSNLTELEREEACEVMQRDYLVEDIGIDYLCMKK